MYTFTVHEVYTQPFYWMLAGTYFGTWTVNKFLVVNMVCGITTEDWDTANIMEGSPVQLGRFTTFAFTVQAYLQQMADAGTPVTERDGSYMQLGNNYLVDYSAYE